MNIKLYHIFHNYVKNSQDNLISGVRKAFGMRELAKLSLEVSGVVLRKD